MRGAVFSNLLIAHANAPDAERGLLEPVIFTKAVDYRRDVKRNMVTADEQSRTDALLSRYKHSIAPATKRKRDK